MTASKNTRVEVAGIEARLANLSTSSGYALGIETPAGIVNVTASGAALGLPAPRGLDDLLQAELAGQLHAVMEALVLHPGSAIVVAEHEVRFAPLVTRPEKIICVGFDYRQHAAETETAIPVRPPLFAKYANACGSIGRPPDDIRWRRGPCHRHLSMVTRRERRKIRSLQQQCLSDRARRRLHALGLRTGRFHDRYCWWKGHGA
ncbi:hypothetical protein [Paraburkholderia sp.]|uniref:hypothetical protein n=1 Tax=Paraburkholderia sp. TaxID=1926495 RepID=UPI0026168D46|nr:hypothetical protein [Paraburkholderia sp.]